MGSYISLARKILPSLILSTFVASGLELQTTANQKYFVLDGMTKNLPYSPPTGIGVTGASSITEILNSPDANMGPASNYKSCTEVQMHGLSVGSGSYRLRATTGESADVNCCSSGSLLVTCP